MSDFPYLISLALLNQNGTRSMPLGGKSINESSDKESLLNEIAKPIALELLIRILKKSDSGPVFRVAKDKSILIAKIDMDSMNNKLPAMKKEWLIKGDNQLFLSEMESICDVIWSIDFIKYEGIVFKKI